jgi:hypothetical protein
MFFFTPEAHMRDAQQAALVLIEKQRHCAQFEEARHKPGTPIYLRHERRDGWSEALPIYAFYCRFCEAHSVNFPAGRYAKVRCDLCRHYTVVRQYALEAEPTYFSVLLEALIIRTRAFVGLNDPPRLPPPEE